MFLCKTALLITFLGVITPLAGYPAPSLSKIKNWLLSYIYSTPSAPDIPNGDEVTVTSQTNTKEQTALCGTLPTLSRLVNVPYSYIPNGNTLDKRTRSEHSCSQTRHSEGILVSKDGFSLFRLPRPQKTDACIGEQKYNNGLHIWRIKWPKEARGTRAVIGIASEDISEFEADGYQNLIGLTDASIGWDINRNEIITGGKVITPYPQDKNYKASSDMALILDMDEKNLSFYDIQEDRFLGKAAANFKGEEWSPALSSVWGRCRIYFKYCGSFNKEPLSLQEICKRSINPQLKTHPTKEFQSINLPPPLQRYLIAPYDSPLDGSDGEVDTKLH